MDGGRNKFLTSNCQLAICLHLLGFCQGFIFNLLLLARLKLRASQENRINPDFISFRKSRFFGCCCCLLRKSWYEHINCSDSLLSHTFSTNSIHYSAKAKFHMNEFGCLSNVVLSCQCTKSLWPMKFLWGWHSILSFSTCTSISHTIHW